MSPSNENVFTDTPQTPFREFIPDLSIDRFTSMRKQDAYEYADAFKKDGNPPWIHGLYLHWRELLAEPYKGVTNDGNVRGDLYKLEDDDVPIERIVRAANLVISKMTQEQKTHSHYHIDSPEWRTWSNPEFLLSPKGIRLDEINQDLREAVMGLLEASLSPEGYEKAVAAMRINGFLGEIIQVPTIMNEFSYNFAFFGSVSLESPWGFSFYGHHLCLNAFFYKRQMILSPWFTGAEPNIIDEGQFSGTKIMRREESLGLQLMQSLPEEFQSRAQIYRLMRDPAMPRGRWNHDDQRHLCGAYRDNRVVPYEGVHVSDLPMELQDLVTQIASEYLLYLPEQARRPLTIWQFQDIASDSPPQGEKTMAKPVVDHSEQHDENNSVDLGNLDDNVETFDHPKWKRTVNLLLVSFHSMMATFSAAAIQSGFVDIAEDFHISVQRASYLTSLFIVVLGAAPLFWRPLGQTYGRRPIFLISLVGSLVGNIGCAKSPSYGTTGLCRAITAWFISPAGSLGSAVVAESFAKKDRARYMGVWTTMVTLGVPLAPFIFGFVTVRVGYRWTYWILAIINAVQFVLFFFLGLETRHVPGQATLGKSAYFTFRRIDPTPIRPVDFIAPLGLITRFNVVIAAVSYSTAFLWGSVTTTFEIPQIFPEAYGFNNQQVGLQYMGIILGTLIGEFAGGFFSDQWMWRRQQRGSKPEPEYRLWLSYFGYLLVICGVVVFFVQIAKSGTEWNITPIIGSAIAAVGNQIVTTIMITYAVDCYPSESAAIGVFITFIRQTLGFIGPFWIPEMLQNTGYCFDYSDDDIAGQRA
ncbi:hypothetical protein FOBRF1_014835 [Fusarium oxysporum]